MGEMLRHEQRGSHNQITAELKILREQVSDLTEASRKTNEKLDALLAGRPPRQDVVMTRSSVLQDKVDSHEDFVTMEQKLASNEPDSDSFRSRLVSCCILENATKH